MCKQQKPPTFVSGAYSGPGLSAVTIYRRYLLETLESFDASRKAGKLPSDRVPMQNTFANTPVHFRHCRFIRGFSSGFITTFDRPFHRLYRGADAADAVFVAQRAFGGLPNAFLGLRVIGHV